MGRTIGAMAAAVAVAVVVRVVSGTVTSADTSAQDWVVLSSSSFITVDGFEVSGATRAGISVLGNEDDGSDATDDVIALCHSHHNGGGSAPG